MNAGSVRSKVLVTGANGYIGSHMLTKLISSSYEVVALVRNPACMSVRKGVSVYSYQLDSDVSLEMFKGVSAVIHLATFTGDRDIEKQKTEIKAINNLMVAASQAQVEKFIFISSQSAKPDAPTFYGRDKWLLEQEVENHGGIIVRPGLVYGGDRECALFGTLCKLVSKFLVVPDLLPSPEVQPVHVDDLCLAIFNIIIKPVQKFEFNIAATESMRFSKFLKSLAWYRYNKYLWSVPFPGVILSFIAMLFKLLPDLKLINSERICGLLALRQMDTQESLDSLGVTLRPLSKGLIRNANMNRQFLIEGRALMSYVSGKSPSFWDVRRYARMIKKLRFGESMTLSFFLLKYPFLLRLADPKSPIIPLNRDDKIELQWRMNAALVISEATPGSSPMFTQFLPGQMFLSVVSLLKQIFLEIPLFFITLVIMFLVRIRLIGDFKVIE